MSQVAADIRATANLIENVGHTQSGYYRVLDKDGNCTGYCVYGALAAVIGCEWDGSSTDLNGIISGGAPEKDGNPRWSAAVTILAKGLRPGVAGVASFSDDTPTPELLTWLRETAAQEDDNA